MKIDPEEQNIRGMSLLMKPSSLFAHGVIYVIVGLLVALFLWSYFGRMDIIVSANGALEPKSEMRKVYVPTAGELIDIYVMEGTPVKKEDLIARIKAPDAVKAATEAVKAKMQLEAAELEKTLLPRKMQLLEKEIENLNEQIRQKGKEYRQLKTVRLGNLPAAQKHRLDKARLDVSKAENDMKNAKRILEKYQRLFDSPGHGGVSRDEYEEKHFQYLKEENAFRQAKIDLENLEYEFGVQQTRAGREVGDAYINLLRLRFERDNKMMQMKKTEKQVNMQYKASLANWKAASHVTFDDLDDDNFLKVRAPVSGIVTYIYSTQRGEKIKAEQPLLAIAPANAEKYLPIRIRDRDRGLLKEGQPVKLKFAAFPYQRYGHIDGILEYISPSAESSKDGSPFYTGHVKLLKKYVTYNQKKIELKYGMTAKAEIVVQKRRIIDLIIDPLKKLNS